MDTMMVSVSSRVALYIYMEGEKKTRVYITQLTQHAQAGARQRLALGTIAIPFLYALH